MRDHDLHINCRSRIVDSYEKLLFIGGHLDNRYISITRGIHSYGFCPQEEIDSLAIPENEFNINEDGTISINENSNNSVNKKLSTYHYTRRRFYDAIGKSVDVFALEEMDDEKVSAIVRKDPDIKIDSNGNYYSLNYAPDDYIKNRVEDFKKIIQNNNEDMMKRMLNGFLGRGL